MSNTQFAFLMRAHVPNREALQSSINALGFDLKLHPEFTPFEDSGFLPFILNGEDGPGFEIDYELAMDVISDDKDLEVIAAGNDVCISMTWRSSMKDFACVMIVSCALAKDFGAIISYEGEEPESLTEILSETQEILQQITG